MSASLSLPPLLDAVVPSASDQRRLQVLAAARSCFARSGFHGASMQQICTEAKMSPGALYRYFPSKDVIIEAIAEEERVHASACMAALDGDGPIVDRLTAVSMGYLRSTRDPETGGLMVEICSESLRNTAVGKRFNELESLIRTAFEDALRSAQDSGEIGPGINLQSVMTIIFALGDGLVLRLRLEPDTDIDAIEPSLRRVFGGLLGKGDA